MDLTDDLINGFEKLKISAFSKLKKINNSSIRTVTIGPNSSKCSEKCTLQQKTGSQHIKNAPYDVLNHNDSLSVRHAIKELDLQRQEKVKDALNARISIFNEFAKMQEINKKQQWLHTQQAFIADIERKESDILQELHRYDMKTSNQHAKLVQHYQEIAARRKKHEEELQEREKYRQLLNVLIEKVRKYQIEYGSEYQQILTMMKTVVTNDDLRNSVSEDIIRIKDFSEIVDQIIRKCKSGEVTEEDVQKIAEVVINIKTIKIKTEDAINSLKNKKEEVKEVPVEIPVVVPQVVQKQTEIIPQKQVVQTEKQAENKNDENIAANMKISQYISLTNLKMYSEIVDFLESHTASFKELLEDSNLKQFRFDCKKAINIPVNAISAINSEHLLDKYNRLHNLLAGQTIMISDKPINASRHPQGIAFCMDLLAKKLVLQGDLMISSNPEAAFCYATVIVSLWNDYPVLGKLLMGYFYKLCPYLVPYYIPRIVGETDEEFYIRQGYQYNNGQIEKQDKFLKRMTGIMRLYSAILITKPKKGHNTTPLNIHCGWQWLVAFLKLEPRLDITATMLHTFLETVGFEMEMKYGRMFQKLIKIIVDKFLPNCRKKCTGGAATRLELLLTDYFKNGKFVHPPGYTPYAYW